MKKLAFTLLSLGILFGSWHLEIEAGGRWISNTTHAPYRIDQVCQDGVQITIVNDIQGDLNNLAQDDTVGIQSPILFKGDIADAWSYQPGDADPPLAKEYFNVIGEGKTVTVDENDLKTIPVEYQGFDEYHHTTVILPFFQPAPIGKTVGVGNSSALSELDSDHLHVVEDCRYFSYSANDSETIANEAIAPDFAGLDPAQIIFQVNSLPANGEVSLSGGTPLAANGTFTLEDLNSAGNIGYAPTDHSFDDQLLTVKSSGIQRVSLNSEGEQLENGSSTQPSISADGQVIAFQSTATNTQSDGLGGYVNTFGQAQIYKYALRLRHLTPVSTEASGQLTSAGAFQPHVSPDGTGVVFTSASNNLMKNAPRYCFGSDLNDTNGVTDVFLAVDFGSIYRPSMFRFDDPANNFNCAQLSNQARWPKAADMRAYRDGLSSFRNRQVVYTTEEPITAPDYSDTNGVTDILLFSNSYSEWVTRAAPSISISPIPTPSFPIPFPLPRQSGDDHLNSAPLATDAPNDRSQRPDISADGAVIVFQTLATDLIKSLGGAELDTNGTWDVYASRWTGSRWATSRVSITSDGAQAEGGNSGVPSVSQFGDHIAFGSFATNLDPAAGGSQFQLFVRDQVAGCTTLLSQNSIGIAGNGDSQDISISGNGRFVAFRSEADNLVEGDTNGLSDVFVIDRDADGDGEFYSDVANCTPGASAMKRISVALDGTEANGVSIAPDISLNGDFVVFQSNASNLVSDDTNDLTDIFVYYMGSEQTITFKGSPANIYLPMITSPN